MEIHCFYRGDKRELCIKLLRVSRLRKNRPSAVSPSIQPVEDGMCAVVILGLLEGFPSGMFAAAAEY
jgi:hypothetical protein